MANVSFIGYVRTDAEAQAIFRAAREGRCRIVNRLTHVEQGRITPGVGYVYNPNESNIKRWTDGHKWGDSFHPGGNTRIYKEIMYAADSEGRSVKVEKSGGLRKKTVGDTTGPAQEQLRLVCYYRENEIDSYAPLTVFANDNAPMPVELLPMDALPKSRRSSAASSPVTTPRTRRAAESHSRSSSPLQQQQALDTMTATTGEFFLPHMQAPSIVRSPQSDGDDRADPIQLLLAAAGADPAPRAAAQNGAPRQQQQAQPIPPQQPMYAHPSGLYGVPVHPTGYERLLMPQSAMVMTPPLTPNLSPVSHAAHSAGPDAARLGLYVPYQCHDVKKAVHWPHDTSARLSAGGPFFQPFTKPLVPLRNPAVIKPKPVRPYDTLLS